MSLADYTKALKLGQKNYRSLLSSGRYAHLPVLDEILSDSSIIKGEANMGVMEIPINLIVGTKTVGRRNAFAANFMPLLEVKSEFAAKWSKLADALQEEGLRDPIIVYEFMNHYYVMEGNKRVSVMKYLGAVSIPGKVTRVVPKQTTDRENVIYYEYMRFFEKSLINYIYFSKEGRFSELLNELNIEEDHYWTDEEREDFRSVYIKFSKAIKNRKGEHGLNFTDGDALLAYLSIYNYETVKEQTVAQIQKELTLVWKEISVSAKADSIELRMDLPDTEPKPTNLLNLFMPETKKLKVAFIYDKTAETSSWTYNHELGRCYVQEVFKGQVETFYYDMVSNDLTLLNALDDAVAFGYNMVFITTPRIMDSAIKFALEHPEIKILTCSLNAPHSVIRTYYGRIYESKFLLGVIAGSLCADGKIGYIADYPIYGMTANINAFVLGAKLVNPRAKVYLRWSTLKSPSNIINEFVDIGVHYISGSDLITPISPSREFGLFKADKVDDEIKIENLAMPVCDWGKLYEAIIRSVINGTWKSEEDIKNQKAINYWIGLSGGVIDILTSKTLPIGTSRLVNLLRHDIKRGRFHPFEGVLYAQGHIMKQEDGKVPTPTELIKLDWLCESIVGEIPNIEDLQEEKQEIVKKLGVKK